MVVLLRRGGDHMIGQWFGLSDGDSLSDDGRAILGSHRLLARGQGITWAILGVYGGDVDTASSWLEEYRYEDHTAYVIPDCKHRDVAGRYVSVIEGGLNGSSMYVPMRFGRVAGVEHIGLLVADSTDNRCFRDEKIKRFMTRLAEIVGIYAAALHRAYYDNLVDSAPVLGQGYLRTFFERMTEDDARRKKAVMCFLDLNDFKSLNDRYGHVTGDEAIRHFSECVCAAFDEDLGKSVWFFRRSGDEFVIIGREADLGGMVRRIEGALREQLKKFPFERRCPAVGNSWYLTASCGVASGEHVDWQKAGRHPLDALEDLSERAMYSTKFLYKAGIAPMDCPVVALSFQESETLKSLGDFYIDGRRKPAVNLEVKAKVLDALRAGKIGRTLSFE